MVVVRNMGDTMYELPSPLSTLLICFIRVICVPGQ